MNFMAKCMKSYKKYVKVSDLEFGFHIHEGVKVISFDTHSELERARPRPVSAHDLQSQGLYRMVLRKTPREHSWANSPLFAAGLQGI
jgi:hypothetical protein